MPETRFKIEWPNGEVENCYSPSSIVKQYFEPGQAYDMAEFVGRSQQALQLASDRVKAKYGSPCGLALGQLQAIESTAKQFSQPDAKVKFLRFLEGS